jgi:hypothetical protein
MLGNGTCRGQGALQTLLTSLGSPGGSLKEVGWEGDYYSL